MIGGPSVLRSIAGLGDMDLAIMDEPARVTDIGLRRSESPPNGSLNMTLVVPSTYKASDNKPENSSGRDELGGDNGTRLWYNEDSSNRPKSLGAPSDHEGRSCKMKGGQHNRKSINGRSRS